MGDMSLESRYCMQKSRKLQQLHLYIGNRPKVTNHVMLGDVGWVMFIVKIIQIQVHAKTVVVGSG